MKGRKPARQLTDAAAITVEGRLLLGIEGLRLPEASVEAIRLLQAAGHRVWVGVEVGGPIDTRRLLRDVAANLAVEHGARFRL